MKALSKKWSPEAEIDTPYKRAQQEWDSRMGCAFAHARNWRLATFCTIIFVALPSIIGMFYLGMQPKAVPHIVDIMEDGSAVYRGAIGREWEKFRPSNRSIIFHLHRFVEDTRTLSSDPAVIKRNWLDAYEILTPIAANTLNAYANENNPFEKAKETRLNIEIVSTAPISDDSWQIDWKESSWGSKGNFIDATYWRGIFKIKIIKPESESDLEKNPIGLFIDEFNWSKINR